MSPYFLCSYGWNQCRNRSSATVCTNAGQVGPSGSPASVDRRQPVAARQRHPLEPLLGQLARVSRLGLLGLEEGHATEVTETWCPATSD